MFVYKCFLQRVGGRKVVMWFVAAIIILFRTSHCAPYHMGPQTQNGGWVGACSQTPDIGQVAWWHPNNFGWKMPLPDVVRKNGWKFRKDAGAIRVVERCGSDDGATQYTWLYMAISGSWSDLTSIAGHVPLSTKRGPHAWSPLQKRNQNNTLCTDENEKWTSEIRGNRKTLSKGDMMEGF